MAPRTEGPAPWPRLGWSAWLPIAILLLALIAVTIPRLPPGVCYSDGADLQVASATLGVMHPPGYGGFVTLGYLITCLPGVDPAYLVTLACLASGLVALWLCALFQVRLGVHPYVACAVALALSVHDRVWKNLLAPEVYAPSVAFLLASGYLLLRFSRIGRARDLHWATLCFGVALGNRPTVVWMLPCFLVAWWCAETARERVLPGWKRRILVSTACAMLPGLYSLGFLWVRDAPQTLHNYIDHHNAETKTLPENTDGWRAKGQRLVYHATAREFRRHMGNDWRGVRMRLRWLYKEFFLYQVVDFLGLSLTIGRVTFVCVAAVLIVGFVLIFRRSRTGFWTLLGLVLGNVAFICTYVIHGMAADLLPLLLAAAVISGVAVSPLFEPATHRVRRVAAISLLVLTCCVTVADLPRRGQVHSADATGFVEQIDMKSLPQDAVICSTWRRSTPLWYAKHILTGRRDVQIINTTTQQWRHRIEVLPDRPVFVVRHSSELKGYTLTPYRFSEDPDGKVRTTLWKVERGPERTPEASESGD